MNPFTLIAQGFEYVRKDVEATIDFDRIRGLIGLAYEGPPPTLDWHYIPALGETPSVGYLNITITRIQPDVSRVLWRDRYPVLHVQCTVQDNTGKTRPYTAVLGGGEQSKANGEWAMADTSVLMQVPYSGGEVSLTVDLLSHPGKDYMEQVMGSVNSLSSLVPSLPFQKANDVLSQTQKIIAAMINIEGVQAVIYGDKGLVKNNVIQAGDHLLYDTRNNQNTVSIKNERDVILNGTSVIGAKDQPFILVSVEIHSKPRDLIPPDVQEERESLKKAINTFLKSFVEEIVANPGKQYAGSIITQLIDPFTELEKAYADTAYLLPVDAASAFQQDKDKIFETLLGPLNPQDRAVLVSTFRVNLPPVPAQPTTSPMSIPADPDSSPVSFSVTGPMPASEDAVPYLALKALDSGLISRARVDPRYIRVMLDSAGEQSSPLPLLAELPDRFDWTVTGRQLKLGSAHERLAQLGISLE